MSKLEYVWYDQIADELFVTTYDIYTIPIQTICYYHRDQYDRIYGGRDIQFCIYLGEL